MTTIREELWKTKGILFNFAIFDLADSVQFAPHYKSIKSRLNSFVTA